MKCCKISGVFPDCLSISCTTRRDYAILSLVCLENVEKGMPNSDFRCSAHSRIANAVLSDGTMQRSIIKDIDVNKSNKFFIAAKPWKHNGVKSSKKKTIRFAIL